MDTGLPTAQDMSNLWAANSSLWNYATMPPAGSAPGTATAQAQAPQTAPYGFGTGTNYAAQLQGALAPMLQAYNYPSNWTGGKSGFDAAYYLAQNPDVAKAVQYGAFPDAYSHYTQFGANEGRSPSGTAGTLNRWTPRAMDYGTALNSFGFNPQYYLQNNPDVGKAVQSGQFASPLQHYLQFGQQEGRPTSNFQATGQTNFFSTPMPNQYRPQAGFGSSPTGWQGMTGSPFGQAYGGMATLPMMSYLQNSPYASLFGFSPPATPKGAALPAAAPSFQIAPGTQTSAPAAGARSYAGVAPRLRPEWRDNAYSGGRLKWNQDGSVRR
jgi:hypothetical protein